jgi:hypothetical protein
MTAHIVLNRGNLIPLTSRVIAIDGSVSVSGALIDVLSAIVDRMNPSPAARWPVADDGIGVYAARDRIYIECLRRPSEAFAVIRAAIDAALERRGATPALRERVANVLDLDAALRPDIEWRRRDETHQFVFDAARVLDALGRMALPDDAAFAKSSAELLVRRPGAVHDLLPSGALGPGSVRGHHMVVP